VIESHAEIVAEIPKIIEPKKMNPRHDKNAYDFTLDDMAPESLTPSQPKEISEALD